MVDFSLREREVEARDLKVRFSPAVQDALRSVAVIARNSEHFDHGIYEIVKAWSADKPTTVHDVMISLPSIFREMTRHIQATHSESMSDALDELCLYMAENGFSVSQGTRRNR